MKTAGFLAAMLTFALPAACLAQEPAGIYVGWSAGQSMTKFDSNRSSFGVANLNESYDKTETAFKVFAGYDFNKTWAVEGGYAGLGTPKINYTGSGALTGTTGRANIKNTAWFAAAKGTIPISNAFGLFARLGLTGNKSDFTATTGNNAVNAAAGLPVSMNKVRTQPLVGAGAEYRLSGNVRLRLEYEDFGKFNTDMDAGHTRASLWSFGATYSF
jgi:OmpA-OmpF porin, OOP family